MPFLIPLAGIIASGIATVTAVVAAAIAAVITTVAAAIGFIATSISIAVTSVISGVISAVSYVGGYVASGLANVYSYIAPKLIAVYKAIKAYSTAVYGYFQEFLEYIHFKTILKIHNIAMLVSRDYRAMMAKVYGEIGRFSRGIGFTAQFLNLVLNDSRKLVLDVTSLTGRGYDLGQVTWLTQMNEHLKFLQENAEFYEQNPWRILTDIQQLVDKPNVDGKAGFMQGFITVIDGVTTIADNTVDKVITLREDLDQAILHLPKSISREIYDEINPIFEGFDRFIEDEYKPVSRDLSNAIRVISDTTIRQTDKLNVLTQNILNPGDLLGNIDNLTELEKIRQEAKIAEIATRAPIRSAKEINQTIDTAHQGIKEIFEAITKVRDKPPYHVKESKGLQYKPGMMPAYAASWFVGDF